MNIRDSYIHGADGKGVVKSLFFVTAADVQADNNLNLNDLGIILADANNSTFYLTIPTLNLNTTGYAALILTEKKENNVNYYLTFVDSNNNSPTAESIYTNAGIYFNPTTGPTNHVGTLYVNNISGDNIGITIGNTFVALGGTYTPVTSITASSTDDDIPSAAAVWAMLSSGLLANDAMIFKGVLNGGTNTTYTPAAECGHVYKVAVAGKINGDYYEVGDTLICAVDGTAAATSSNVSTVKTNWYAIQTNISDYLLKTGGTMTGNLKWKDTTALPTIDSMANANILVVDGMDTNTDGTTKQISLASLLNSMNLSPSIGAGTTTNTVKITVNGTDSSDYTIPYATSAANLTGGALGSIPYLTAEGTTQFLAGGSNNQVLRYDGTNKKPYWGADVNTWRNVYVGGTSKVGNSTDTKAMNFASSNINITYLASGTNTGQSSNANYFTINFEAKNWSAATSSTAGTAGYMPAPTSAQRLSFLRGDGTWVFLEENKPEGAVNHFGQTVSFDGGVTKMPDIHGYRATGSLRRISDLGFNGYTIWTVSGYFKADSAITVNINLCDKSSDANYGEGSGISLTTEYVYHKLTFTNVNTYNVSGNYNGFLDIEGSSSIVVYVKDLMIEHGYVAHEWRPSISELTTGMYASGTWGISITGSAGSVAWENITSKPAAIGSATQPVYWNGSTFVLADEYLSVDDLYWADLKVTLQANPSTTPTFGRNITIQTLQANKYPTIYFDEYYDDSHDSWIGKISTDYYGNSLCNETGWTHGMYFISGRSEYDHFFFLKADNSPLVKLSKDGNVFVTNITAPSIINSTHNSADKILMSDGSVLDKSTFALAGHNHNGSYLKYYSKNYSNTINNAKDIEDSLDAGLARVHISNVEYSSVFTMYDYNNKSILLRAYNTSGGGNLYIRSKAGGNTWHLMAAANNISDKAATLSTSSKTIATIAGVNITAKIEEIAALASSLGNITKTLTVDNWTTMVSISDLVGTYAIQIKCETLYASGIFSACGGSDVMIDEIPLHVVNSTNGSTWRPYARISGGNLQMTTNETSGTERTYTINIIKLI